MSLFSRDALEGSPLADLHAIASELGIDGFRRLRKGDLVDTILERQPGGAPAEEAVAVPDSPSEDDASAARPRRSRGGRGRSRAADDGFREPTRATAARSLPTRPSRPRPPRPPRPPAPARRTPRSSGEGRRRENGRRSGGDRDAAESEGGAEKTVEGTVEVLANGSGFVRLSPPEPSDDDVYVSAAQVRRCELVSGDTISGPVRRPRRSERYPSLVRVETINGNSADEVSVPAPFDELAAAFPSTPIVFKAKDATLKQISDLAPIGRGSRVSVVGPHGSGRTTTLRLLAIELAAEEGVEVSVVLAGSRPEETAGVARRRARTGRGGDDRRKRRRPVPGRRSHDRRGTPRRRSRRSRRRRHRRARPHAGRDRAPALWPPPATCPTAAR